MNNDFDLLEVGDIIWAKRYNNEIEKANIKEGHRHSPYVIIKKTKRKIYMLQSTSNPHSNIEWEKVLYGLDRITYGFDKKSFINTTLTELLTPYRYIKRIGHLTEQDLNKLRKYLYIVIKSNYRYKLDLKDKDIKFYFEVGDIIIFKGEKYYIYKIDDKKYYTYYTFEINRRRKVCLLNTFNSGEIKLFDNYINEQQNKSIKENNNNLIGSLISYNNNFYYIFEESEKYYGAIRIFTSEFSTNSMSMLQINGGFFYTYFNTVRLSKESQFKKRRKAVEVEINKNHEIIKNKSKEKINLEKFNKSVKSSFERFEPMTIIYNIYSKKYYLIISKNDNIIEIVNINDFSDYFYFALEKGKCPFKFHRIVDLEEFESYNSKIKEIKEIVSKF